MKTIIIIAVFGLLCYCYGQDYQYDKASDKLKSLQDENNRLKDYWNMQRKLECEK